MSILSLPNLASKYWPLSYLFLTAFSPVTIHHCPQTSPPILLPGLSSWISAQEGILSNPSPGFVALVWIFASLFGFFVVKPHTDPSTHCMPVMSPTHLSSPVLPFSCTGMILAAFPLPVEEFGPRNPLVDNSQQMPGGMEDYKHHCIHFRKKSNMKCSPLPRARSLPH